MGGRTSKVFLLGALAALCLQAANPPQDAPRPAFWQVVERAVAKQEVDAPFERVLEHMREVPGSRDHVSNRLARINQGITQPWTPPALAADLKQRLASPVAQRTGAPLQELVPNLVPWLDMTDYRSPAKREDLQELQERWKVVQSPSTKGLALLQALSEYVEEAHKQLGLAHSELTPEEASLLFEEHSDFYDAFKDKHDPKKNGGRLQLAVLTRYTSLFSELKSDREKIFAVAESLLGLTRPSFLKSLAQRLAHVRQPGLEREYDKDVLAVVGDADWNRVVLMGKGQSKQDFTAALTIDLGGDDTYEQAAVADHEDMLVAIVLDLGGDDHYESGDPGPVFSAGGVAILLDRKGNDTYESERLGLAASLIGFAALFDLEGDDTYVAEDYAQGHSTCGMALLYDFAGNDTYSAHAFAQGSGIGSGLCALVDGGGDDEYLADGHWPDVYGNSGPDVFHGGSQGFSTGIRSNVAGGVAALIDLGDGKDRYQAGSFSQGGGYYFAFGLMFDGGGDDQTFGSRYAQGFGVHQGIGVKWDAGGDDLYKCRSIAHAGMAWDEGVGYLIDDDGDDTYQVGDLGCGAAAQTGIALLIDHAGSDTYVSGKNSQGATGKSDYHDKPSIGILLDLGGGKDIYSAEERTDETLRVTDGVQLFLDTKAKTPAKALQSKLLR